MDDIVDKNRDSNFEGLKVTNYLDAHKCIFERSAMSLSAAWVELSALR